MEYRCKVTVIDKKLFPELQEQYCAVPYSGKCPCYNTGDEFIFYRNEERDDYWHCGAGTLIKSGEPDSGCLQSPGTARCGSKGVPFLLGSVGRYQPIHLRRASRRRHYARLDKRRRSYDRLLQRWDPSGNLQNRANRVRINRRSAIFRDN